MNSQKAKKVRHLIIATYLLSLVYIVWSWQRFATLEGDAALISIGGLLGLIGGFMLLVQMTLTSGASWIERSFALDRLTRIHRVHGFIAFWVIITHPLFITLGYSRLSGLSFQEQQIDLLKTAEGVFLAATGYYLLIFIILISVFRVRRHLKYETWYYLHQLTYLVILLPLFHQLALGPTISGDTFRTFWLGLYALAFGNSLIFKWIRPLRVSFKHALLVDKVEDEAEGIISIYVTGKDIAKFKYQAGQFAFWYFWQPGFRLQKHPFTISSSPGNDYLRLTPKALGDYTKNLGDIKSGTRVFIDGPYGRFSNENSVCEKRLFIAGGIGVTPIKSMLGDELKSEDILLYGTRNSNEIAFRSEFSRLRDQGLNLQYIYSEEEADDAQHGYIDKDKLAQIPELLKRDIYLCGPPSMMRNVEKSLEELEVPNAHIHTEKFSLT